MTPSYLSPLKGNTSLYPFPLKEGTHLPSFPPLKVELVPYFSPLEGGNTRGVNNRSNWIPASAGMTNMLDLPITCGSAAPYHSPLTCGAAANVKKIDLTPFYNALTPETLIPFQVYSSSPP
jgi:hypothetical protein